MNPLETLLADGRNHSFGWRTSLARSLGSNQAPLNRIAMRAIWPRRLKHMRYLAKGISIKPEVGHRFTISSNGASLVKCLSLAELLPSMEMPISIVATGPSARDYPWEQVRNRERFLIGVNGAPTMLKGLGIVPDLLVITDREFAQTGAKHLEAAPGVPLVIEFLAAAALASVAPELLINRSVALIERVNMWYGLPFLKFKALNQLNAESGMPFVFPSARDPAHVVGWSHRPELGFFPGRTVVFAALQIAIGRGAKDLEIIGMDLSGSGRSYAEGPEKRPTQLQEHYDAFILPAFQIMCRALAGRNVIISNHSSVCPLPAELFGDHP